MKEENSLGDVLSSLLANKEVMAAVSSIAKVGEDGVRDNTASAELIPSKGDLSLPPELISALPSVMSAISGTGILSQGKPPDQHSGEGRDQKSKRALLCALKPFLCEKRCALIDTLVQLEGIRSLLGTMSEKQKSEGEP